MFIGQEVFRTIVEMAYEMEFCDKLSQELTNCALSLPEIIEATQDNRNKSTRLRKLYVDKYTKQEPVRYSLPWKCFGKEYSHQLRHGYERYRNARGQVRERGILVITVVEKAKNIDGWRELRYWSRETYTTDEEFTTAKQSIQNFYRNGLGYYMWGGRVDERKPKYLK